jgi:hypothetical protein
MDANAVGCLYPDAFGNFRLAEVTGVSLAATGDIATLVPQAATKYIVRRVTLSNFSGAASNANVALFPASGGTGTAVANAQVTTGATATTSYVDLTLSASGNSTVLTAKPLYLRLNANTNSVTCDVAVYGDIVTL